MRIAVDAMGGDFGPSVIVPGAVEAARIPGFEILLVGDEKTVRKAVRAWDARRLPIEIVHASQVVFDGESPAISLRRKPGSSIRVAVDLVKTGRADAAVSAGPTGASMAAAVHTLGRLPGVIRPAIGANLPRRHGHTLLIDAGANVDCTVLQLIQFAHLGAGYVDCLPDQPADQEEEETASQKDTKRGKTDDFSRIDDDRGPTSISGARVGLLSNGSEETKGNSVLRETHAVLKESSLNYAGFVEGRDIFSGKVDVAVCDGLAGNLLVKAAEGLGAMMHGMAAEAFGAKYDMKGRPEGLTAKFLQAIAARVDYHARGGAPLLGVKGVVMVGHGDSSSKAVSKAVEAAGRLAEARLPEVLAETIGRMPGL